ncbi:MAG: two-component regulator propeller domain-containing protein, partial [Bacteroidota bacterium]
MATAQDKTIVLKHITTSEGLSDNQVTCMLRDDLGFMWIGTKDGLNRYDGREFYVFKNNPEEINSVCSNYIKCLELDGDSLLWIGTSDNGFCSYDSRTGKFTSYNKNNLALITNRINDIAYDKYKNQLWIAQNNHGLQIFDLKTKSIDRNKKLISKNTYYDVEIKDSVAYFAGIVESLKRIENIGKFRTPVEKEGRTLNKILLAQNGTIWCGAWDNGLHEFNSGTQRLNTYFFDGSNKLKQSGDEILSLVEDENNILWCGTKSSGIHFFDIEKRMFIKQFKFSIPVNARVNNLYRDDFNRVWIATETGLYVYDPLQNQFEIIKLPAPPGTNSCKVNDRVVLSGRKEFIATNCGLFYKNEFDSVYRFKEIIYRNEKQELTSIFSDDEKRIFIGTNRTIFLLDTISLNLTTVPANKKTLSEAFYFIPASRVNSITRINHDGLLLIAASFYGHSIAFLDPTRKNIFYMLEDTLKKEGFLDNLSRKLFTDSKNNFWVCGASNGITKVIIPPAISFSNCPVSDSLIRNIYVDNKNWSKKSSEKIGGLSDVYDIVENYDGSYWLTTQGKGLVKFFPGNDTLPFISYAGNLNSLQGLTRDDNGNLWIISSAGLLKYNTASQRYTLYNTKAGIPESLAGYFFQGNSTSVSAGFDGGFITFNPGKILTDTEKPRVFISRIWVMDSKADSLLYSPIKLNYDNNFLKFYLSSNCFSNNEQVRYMYQ